MLSEEISKWIHLSERVNQALKSPHKEKSNFVKKEAPAAKNHICDFYPRLPCTLPHIIYDSCTRCVRAYGRVDTGVYEPRVNTRDIYEKIVSLSFFFSEKKNPAL